MRHVPLSEKNIVEPVKLIGTKWVGWSEFIGDRMTVEFVDKTNCIYTSYQKKYPMTYSVMKGKLFISDIEGPFELHGQVLFNNGLPAFEKAA